MSYEKFNFGPDYQDALLASLIQYPEEFTKYHAILRASFFTGTQRVATARAVFDFWREHGLTPQWDIITQVVFDAIARTSEEKDEDSIMAYIYKLRDRDCSDYKALAKRVVMWAKRRAIWAAIEHASVKFNAGEEPEDGFIPLFTEALRVGEDVQDLGYLIGPDSPDIPKVIDEYTQRGYSVSSGYDLLDQIMPSKGFEPGWLIAILAPPKRYKTTFCINLAMNMAAMGEPVFYYPCEITQRLAAIRTLCRLTNRPVSDIFADSKAFTNLAMREARELMGAPVLIKGYASKAATISGTIRSHALNSIQQIKMKPKAVFIDFAETVSPTNHDPKSMSDHRAQSQIYTEARALASELECPVFLPDRCNKETVDKAVPSMTSFQGSFEKAGIVDMGIGLCGTDQEVLDHFIRYFVFLFRHGEAGQHFRGNITPNTYMMSVDSLIPWRPEDEGERDAQQDMRRHRRRRTPPSDIEQ